MNEIIRPSSNAPSVGGVARANGITPELLGTVTIRATPMVAMC